MEPNTQPTIPNKNKKILIIIAIVILVIIAALVLMKSKVNAPVDMNEVTDSSLQGDNKVLANEIDSATTFDNEADLKEIDKEFQ